MPTKRTMAVCPSWVRPASAEQSAETGSLFLPRLSLFPPNGFPDHGIGIPCSEKNRELPRKPLKTRAYPGRESAESREISARNGEFPVNSLLTAKPSQNRTREKGEQRHLRELGREWLERCVSDRAARSQTPEISREIGARRHWGNETGVGGGGGGIRTHGTLSRTPVFKTGAFDHSATPPTGASDRPGGAILEGVPCHSAGSAVVRFVCTRFLTGAKPRARSWRRASIVAHATADRASAPRRR